MDERIAQYIAGSQQDVIVAAEAKLKRPLSEQERAGIQGLQSTMRLDGLYMAFSHASTSPEEVAEELAHFANQQARGPIEPTA